MLLLEHQRSPIFDDGCTLYNYIGAKPNWPRWRIERSYMMWRSTFHADRLLFDDPALKAELLRRGALIDMAWSVLGDPDLRDLYDTTGTSVSREEINNHARASVTLLIDGLINSILKEPALDLDSLMSDAKRTAMNHMKFVIRETEKQRVALQADQTRIAAVIAASPTTGLIYKRLLQRQASIKNEMVELLRAQLVNKAVPAILQKETEDWIKHEHQRVKLRNAKQQRVQDAFLDAHVQRLWTTNSAKIWTT